MQLNRVRALASLVLCLFCSAVLDAATVPVDVDFAIDVAGMRNAWTPAEQQQIVSDVRKSLVDYLHTTYRYWAFQEKTGQASVVLSFKVVETIPNQISLRLEFLLGGVKVYETPMVEANAINIPERDAVGFQFDVPLAGLKPGTYVCQVNVIDDAGANFSFPRMALRVIPPAAAAPVTATGEQAPAPKPSPTL